MKEKVQRDLIDFLLEDDQEFFEQFLSRMTEEEYQKFLGENPEFCNHRE